jgi:hypothetical protein
MASLADKLRVAVWFYLERFEVLGGILSGMKAFRF